MSNFPLFFFGSRFLPQVNSNYLSFPFQLPQFFHWVNFKVCLPCVQHTDIYGYWKLMSVLLLPLVFGDLQTVGFTPTKY